MENVWISGSNSNIYVKFCVSLKMLIFVVIYTDDQLLFLEEGDHI